MIIYARFSCLVNLCVIIWINTTMLASLRLPWAIQRGLPHLDRDHQISQFCWVATHCWYSLMGKFEAKFKWMALTLKIIHDVAISLSPIAQYQTSLWSEDAIDVCLQQQLTSQLFASHFRSLSLSHTVRSCAIVISTSDQIRYGTQVEIRHRILQIVRHPIADQRHEPWLQENPIAEIRHDRIQIVRH